MVVPQFGAYWVFMWYLFHVFLTVFDPFWIAMCKQRSDTRSDILIKIQLDATVRSLIYFTAQSLYMFRVSTALIIRGTKNCNRSLRYRS